ncbi:hypothetical protein CHUAL_007593 [Chamberlinius hualienensis]
MKNAGDDSTANSTTESEEEESSRHEDAVDNPTKTKGEMLYRIGDRPPWYAAIALALQQYLAMFSSTVTTPYIIAPALCIPDASPARAYILSTIMFVSGIVTLLQTTIGVRLPIVQGASATFYAPMFALMALPKWQCTTNTTDNITLFPENANITWEARMCEIQGAIAVASVLPVILSFFGIINILMKYITPLVVAPTVTLIGLSLLQSAADMCAENWIISLTTIAVMVLCCEYLEFIKFPIPKYSKGKGWRVGWFPWFKFYPVITTILIMWFVCYMLTINDTLPKGDKGRTDDKSDLIADSPWFRFPYPGQWGLPTVSVAGVVGMLAAVIAAMVESIGDYYACARLSEAPNPPAHAVDRGILIEGIGCVLAGVWGTGSGTTSYGDNIGAISLTKVASRSVIQISTIFMFLFGVVTKIGAIFVSIPEPIIGGIFLVMFGLITAIGISNVQYINLNSSRNIFILGFSLFFGMAIPNWVIAHPDAIDTGNEVADEILNVLLTTNMLVGGVLGFIFDNTIKGSREDRGLDRWLTSKKREDLSEKELKDLEVYEIPYITNWMSKHKIFKYLPFCPTYQPITCNCCSKNKPSSSSNSIELSNQSDHDD